VAVASSEGIIGAIALGFEIFRIPTNGIVIVHTGEETLA
jgi:hypothetical protein